MEPSVKLHLLVEMAMLESPMNIGSQGEAGTQRNHQGATLKGIRGYLRPKPSW